MHLAVPEAVGSPPLHLSHRFLLPLPLQVVQLQVRCPATAVSLRLGLHTRFKALLEPLHLRRNLRSELANPRSELPRSVQLYPFLHCHRLHPPPSVMALLPLRP